MTAKSGATLTKQPDGSILVSGKPGVTDLYTITATTKAAGLTAIRLELLPDKTLPAMGPGRAPQRQPRPQRHQSSARMRRARRASASRSACTAPRRTFSQPTFDPNFKR